MTSFDKRTFSRNTTLQPYLLRSTLQSTKSVPTSPGQGCCPLRTPPFIARPPAAPSSQSTHLHSVPLLPRCPLGSALHLGGGACLLAGASLGGGTLGGQLTQLQVQRRVHRQDTLRAGAGYVGGNTNVITRSDSNGPGTTEADGGGEEYREL